MVRDSYSSKSDPSYSQKEVVGNFRKAGSSWRTSYVPDETGNYVGVIDSPRFRNCWVCQGTGKVLPSGFDPEASYRATCQTCNDTGQSDAAKNIIDHIINRKDMIMSLEDYEPIRKRKYEQKLAQEQGRIAREQRVNSLISELIQIVRRPIDEDKELAIAEFIGKYGYGHPSPTAKYGYVIQSELVDAARKVREERRKVVTNGTA